MNICSSGQIINRNLVKILNDYYIISFQVIKNTLSLKSIIDSICQGNKRGRSINVTCKKTMAHDMTKHWTIQMKLATYAEVSHFILIWKLDSSNNSVVDQNKKFQVQIIMAFQHMNFVISLCVLWFVIFLSVCSTTDRIFCHQQCGLVIIYY